MLRSVRVNSFSKEVIKPHSTLPYSNVNCVKTVKCCVNHVGSLYADMLLDAGILA